MKKKRELYRINSDLTHTKLIELSRMWRKLFNNHISEVKKSGIADFLNIGTMERRWSGTKKPHTVAQHCGR